MAVNLNTCSVADPGFPVGGGGVDPLGGVWTSDTGAFQQKCMQKRKNWVLQGGVHLARPLDPPMHVDGKNYDYTENCQK